MASRNRLDNPPPVVLLRSPERRAERDRKLRQSLPNLAEHLEYLNAGRPPKDPNDLLGHVFATRKYGLDFVGEHPEIDPAEPVLIDCMWVEVASVPPIHEILKAWPLAQFFNCNEDMTETVAYVREKLK